MANLNSHGMNESDGVNRSNGVNLSDGVNGSDGVNWSNGVNRSYGVSWSRGVNWSNGVSGSHGVNWSYGVSWSRGVNWSNGVNRSYGVINSYGVDRAIFTADKKKKFTLFDKEVPESRFNEVWDKIQNLNNGWYPKFNNAFELYLQNGSGWEKVDASEIASKLNDWEKPYEAWKDMPKETIDYLKSLPEFDAKIFLRVTGIDVGKDSEVDKKKKELLDKADELIKQANELKSKANEF